MIFLQARLLSIPTLGEEASLLAAISGSVAVSMGSDLEQGEDFSSREIVSLRAEFAANLLAESVCNHLAKFSLAE